MSIVTGIGGGIGSRGTACSGIRRRARASTLEPFAGGGDGGTAGAGGGSSRTGGGAAVTRSRDGAGRA